MRRLFVIAILSTFLSPLTMAGQDFILQGCYWDCPDDAAAEIDPASFNFWVQKIKEQSPALGHAGFSYVWLPAYYPAQEQQVVSLINSLHRSGVETFIDLDLNAAFGKTDYLELTLDEMTRLQQYLTVSGFRLTGADREVPPELLTQLLARSAEYNLSPRLLAVRTREKRSPEKLAAYINSVERATAATPAAENDLRIFDYPLRESLRRACSDPGYDVRKIFAGSIRDVTTLSGFNIITFINSPEFYNPNGISGDEDDLIDDPLLAYVYILTNNQLGLPAVFYGDYFGPESEIEYFLDQRPLQEDIDQLIKTHREFIFNSTSVEYLNRKDSPRKAKYLSSSARRSLIFQIDGNNTPAGVASPDESKDVLVAINFADTVLQVIQEINMSNAEGGDRFTDILGRSNYAETIIDGSGGNGIPNAVYLELPPRSYSIWVHGKAEKVLTSPIEFSADTVGGYVELSWEVADESNIRIYQVERSVKGDQFENLSVIKALGNPGESAAYLHIDQNIKPNVPLYYRIKAVSADGRFESSPVEEVFFPKEVWDLEVLGEKAGVQLIRITSSFDNDEVNLSIFNAGGELLSTSDHAIRKDRINQIEVDLSGFPDGIYFVTITSGGNKRWTHRFVKL